MSVIFYVANYRATPSATSARSHTISRSILEAEPDHTDTSQRAILPLSNAAYIAVAHIISALENAVLFLDLYQRVFDSDQRHSIHTIFRAGAS